MALANVYRRVTKRVMPALVVMTLAMGAASRGQTPPAGGTNPPPTKLAVVSIVNLFDALDEKADADTRIDQMKKTYENESRTLQQALEEMQKEIESPKLFAKGSPEYKKLQDD